MHCKLKTVLQYLETNLSLSIPRSLSLPDALTTSFTRPGALRFLLGIYEKFSLQEVKRPESLINAIADSFLSINEKHEAESDNFVCKVALFCYR